MVTPPGSGRNSPQPAPEEKAPATDETPASALSSQLQGLSLGNFGSSFGGFGAFETQQPHPQLSSSPTGSLASGSSISQLSVRSDTLGRSSLSGVSLYARLNDSALSYTGSSAAPLSGSDRFAAAAAAAVSSVDGFPAAHASVPGSVHGSIHGSVPGSIPGSGASTPQRFLGTLGSAGEPPTLPPAGESAFASYTGRTSSPGFGATATSTAATGTQFDLHGKSAFSVSNASSPITYHGNGDGSNGIMGHSGSTPYSSYGSSPVHSQPLQQHVLHQQQRTQQMPLGPVGRALQQASQQGQQQQVLQQHPGSGPQQSHPNPFPQYNMQQPSAGFYTNNYGNLAGPQQPGAGGGAPGGPALGSGGAGSGTGSPAWPPQEISLNLNKAITKRLASATHYQQLLDIIADSAMYFDEVNVATALHRLARLHCTSATSNAATIIVTSDQFKLLLAAIRKLLPRFEAQAVSNTAWALATLAYLPEGDLLRELALRATAIIRTFRPQATSNTLWAYAKLGVLPPEAFMAAAAQQMQADLSRSVPQDLSNSLWAYATLRYSPGVALLNGAAAHAIYCMPRFKPQEVANTLWSYATLGHDPGAPLLDAIAAHICDRMHVFRPQASSNSLWAYAKLNYNPGRELLEAAARRALAALHQYTPQELGNTLWALAVLEHHPGAHLLEAAAAHILRRLDHFGPADTSNSIWAYARLFTSPGTELLQAVGQLALRQWHRFRAAEAANLVWALAILRAPSPQVWAGVLEKLAHAPAASFNDADLHQIFQAYQLLDPAIKRAGTVAPASAFPHALLEEAEARWKAAVRAPPHQSHLQAAVSQVLWSMGVKHSTHHITFDGLFCVDIALEGEQVIIEVDGPDNFSVNSHRPLGRMVGRRCMLEARGYVVRSIAYYEWNSLDTVDAQRAYVTQLLASVFG